MIFTCYIVVDSHPTRSLPRPPRQISHPKRDRQNLRSSRFLFQSSTDGGDVICGLAQKGNTENPRVGHATHETGSDLYGGGGFQAVCSTTM